MCAILFPFNVFTPYVFIQLYDSYEIALSLIEYFIQIT